MEIAPTGWTWQLVKILSQNKILIFKHFIDYLFWCVCVWQESSLYWNLLCISYMFLKHLLYLSKRSPPVKCLLPESPLRRPVIVVFPGLVC